MIYNGENNFMQNKCNKWIKYRNVLPNHQNADIGSSAIDQWTEIYLLGLDMRGMKIQD